MALPGIRGLAGLRMFPRGLAAPGAHDTVVNGTPIGGAGDPLALGSTWVLVDGDDFVSPIDWYNAGINPTGRYSASNWYGSRRLSTGNADVSIQLDPYYRGQRSQSPVNLGYDPITQAGTTITGLATAITAPQLPYMPQTFTQGGGDGSNRPRISGVALRTGPSFQFSAEGSFILAVRGKFPAGAPPKGWHPCMLWTTAPKWPDLQEVDLAEGQNDAGVLKSGFNLNGSTTNGGANVPIHLTTYQAIPTDRFVTYVVWVNRATNQIRCYSDEAVEGVLAQVGSTYTNSRVSRFVGPHDIRLDLCAQNDWGEGSGATFDISTWPYSMEWDWWQMWAPEGCRTKSPTVQLPVIELDPGEAYSGTIPDNATLFGYTPDNLLGYAQYSNFDEPGQATASLGVPGGMTINFTARTLTWTAPAMEGGQLNVYYAGTNTVGGAASLAVQPIRVSPAPQASLFANLSVNYSASGTLNVAYVDFHGGNLGPWSYTASSDKVWAVVTMAGDNRSFSVAYTAPTSDDVATITINCQNQAGQTTTVQRTITSTSSWSPSSWGALRQWYEPNAANGAYTTAVDGNTPGATPATPGSNIGFLRDFKTNLNLFGSTALPTMVADGGRNVLDFNSASTQRLTRDSSTGIGTTFGGNSTPVTVVALLKRGPPGVSCRFMSAHENALGSPIQYGIVASNSQAYLRGAGANVTSGAGEMAADDWYVATWCFTGSAIIMRVNGVQNYNAAYAGTTQAITGMVLGATKSGTSTYTLPFDGRLDTLFISSDSSISSDVISAENYLKALRGIP